jgi:hypothetical protein
MCALDDAFARFGLGGSLRLQQLVCLISLKLPRREVEGGTRWRLTGGEGRLQGTRAVLVGSISVSRGGRRRWLDGQGFLSAWRLACNVRCFSWAEVVTSRRERSRLRILASIVASSISSRTSSCLLCHATHARHTCTPHMHAMHARHTWTHGRHACTPCMDMDMHGHGHAWTWTCMDMDMHGHARACSVQGSGAEAGSDGAQWGGASTTSHTTLSRTPTHRLITLRRSGGVPKGGASVEASAQPSHLVVRCA